MNFRRYENYFSKCARKTRFIHDVHTPEEFAKLEARPGWVMGLISSEGYRTPLGRWPGFVTDDGIPEGVSVLGLNDTKQNRKFFQDMVRDDHSVRALLIFL
jgi:hypothetical protein